MYDVYYSLKEEGWKRHNKTVSKENVTSAIMSILAELGKLFPIKEVTLLPVSEREFVIWVHGGCKGFLAIEDVGLRIQEQDSEKG